MVGRRFDRPTCAEVLANFGNFQLTKRRVKEHESFETMRNDVLKNVEDDSIILEYLSKLDEHAQTLPEIVGNFITTITNNAAKQLDIVDDDQDEREDEEFQEFRSGLLDNAVEIVRQPILSLLNPNHEIVKAALTVLDVCKDSAEHFERARFRNKK